MKFHALALALVMSTPAVAADEIAVQAADQDDGYFVITPADEAKLEAVEKQPLEVTERAHQEAMKRAGVVDNTVDPYSVKLYSSPETGTINVQPEQNVLIYRTEGTKHEDRTGAVVTGTDAYLGR